MKNKIEEAPAPEYHFSNCMAVCNFQMEGRNKRKKNSIIVGFDETTESPSSKDEKASVFEFLKIITPDTSIDDIKIMCIGKRSFVIFNPRPMKIIFQNEQTVAEVLRAFIQKSKKIGATGCSSSHKDFNGSNFNAATAIPKMEQDSELSSRCRRK